MKKIKQTTAINSLFQKTSKSKLKYSPPVLVTLGMSSDTASKTIRVLNEGYSTGPLNRAIGRGS